MNEFNDKYVTIQGWMLDLGLSNNELMCFAIINGFSQDDESAMKGGIAYLQKWMNVGKKTVITILKKLHDMKYIEREEVILKDGKHVFYRVVKNLHQGRCKIYTKVGVKNLPSNNNREIYNGNKEKRLSNDNKKKEDISFEDFYKLYPLKKSRKPAETKWNSLSVKDKKAAIEVLPQYIADCISHKRNFKYPATYLNQRTWEDDFTPVEAEQQENNKQPNGLPVGLTEERWNKFQSWGKKKIPSIIDNITPYMFLDMQRESCFRTGIMAKVLCDMEKKPSTGELLQDFIVLCEGKYSEDIKRSIGLT